MAKSDASPQGQLESGERQQPSNSEGDTVMSYSAKKEQKADDNIESESSSNESDGGKAEGSGSGSESGEGYSADYSSSDASSLEAEATKGNVHAPDQQFHRLSLNGGAAKEKTRRAKEAKPSKGPKQGAQNKSQKSVRRGSDQTESSYYLQSAKEQEQEPDYESSTDGNGSQEIVKQKQNSSLPQWKKGASRIFHPMDPRIDLSTVSHIRTSSVPAFSSEVDEPSRKYEEPPENSDVGPPPPSIDQYIKLMEVVHPFFHAQGVAQGYSHTRSDEPRSPTGTRNVGARPSSDFATTEAASDNDQKAVAGECEIEAPVAAAWNTSRISTTTTASPYAVYRHGGSNASSSSSDKQVRSLQPQHAEAEELRNQHGPMDQDDSSEDPGEDMRAQTHEEEPATARQQERTSASSSEERNNHEGAPQDGPLRYRVPAVVSEYSSSARASSGASNNNIMSTSGSGSGSGGNTGSGTASGSNQGGSSGSGNDQGGNGVKGSSEETMDNSGENNSGENSGGNSDEKNSNYQADTPHVSAGHRHSSNAPEIVYRDPALRIQPLQARGDGHHNAAREKKLQNKKRKRMNMRREYEEKVQQEMESSEGSRDRGENFLRPGRPVTLDKVLSFTKIARIVIKAGPPFLVVYTNAAYSRLSGIDSHAAIGKPIASLLSVPDPDTLAKIDDGNKGPSIETLTAVGAENVGESVHQEGNEAKNEDASAGRQTHFAAEAAGRARAAASQEDPTEMGLERLVAASGFGRCHVVHVSAKPHHLLGRDITVMKQVNSHGTEMRSREEGMCNGSSITSGYNGPYHMVPCSMGVSPVVSSPEAFTAAVVTDKDQDNHHHKTKRRKHPHHSDSQQSNATHHQHRRNNLMREAPVHRKRHFLITHYVIQLELYETTLRKFGGLESHSSTSSTVEAHMLGLTKSELRRQRTRGAALQAQAEDGSGRPPGDDEDDDDMESESSVPREPVAAIG